MLGFLRIKKGNNMRKLILIFISILYLQLISAGDHFERTGHQDLIIKVLEPYNEAGYVTTPMLADAERIVAYHYKSFLEKHQRRNY